jgi:hypothetical protein
MFAMCVPGLAPLASWELEALDGVTVTDTGFDGRSDVVLFEVQRGHRQDVLSLRTVEDLFVEVGRALRADGDNARWIAQRIWRPRRVTRFPCRDTQGGAVWYASARCPTASSARVSCCSRSVGTRARSPTRTSLSSVSYDHTLLATRSAEYLWHRV